MLCYRCGSHVPDTADQCPTCGQRLTTGRLRQATATFSRRRPAPGLVEAAPFKPDDLVAGRYVIRDIAGAGPLGFVFRAHDKELGVEVALKVIAPRLVQSADERKLFASLLRSAKKLSHPNVVRVYEEGEHRDSPYFTSQFLDGLTLRRIIDLRLEKGGFFTLAEIEPIVSQVCAALEGAHTLGPHSNLKPDNVLVLPDLLKLTDFGLGLALPRRPFVQAMKAKKADRYLAPELLGGGELDGRADLYSVGVILGEMLTGLTPDGVAPELSRRNPAIPAGVEATYRRAVNPNPNARHRSPIELAAEIRGLLDRPEGAHRPAAPRRTIRLETSDATQPVDPELLAKALTADLGPAALLEAISAEPSTLEPFDEGDQPPARVGLDQASANPAPFSPVRALPKKQWVPVLLLVVVGVALGAGGGFFAVSQERAVPVPQPSVPPQTAPEWVTPEALVEDVPSSPELKTAEVKEHKENKDEEKERDEDEDEGKPMVVGQAVDAGCPDGMRLVAAGVFKMGTAGADPMMGFDEKNLTMTDVRQFCIDAFEHPNQRGTQPLVAVGWADAMRHCEARGLRLCSEAEWEKACKGPATLRWPYGDTFDASACNTEDEWGDPRALAPSGKFARCRSGYGVADLSGNVSEWTREKVIKGGSFASSDYAARCSARKRTGGSKTSEVGFRCCVESS